MNKIVSTDFIADDVQRLVPVDAAANTPKNAAVAKLMKAWEAKTTQRTAKGAGLTLMALSLAACNDDNTTAATTTPTTPTTPVTPAGQTFTLTTANEALVGAAGNDSISGIVDFAGGRAEGAKSTFNLNDTVDGGAGTDSLTLTVQNAGAAVTNVAGTVGKATIIQVVAATAVAATAADNSLKVIIGTKTFDVAIATGETATNIASAIANVINLEFGQEVAVKGAVASGVFTAGSTGTVVQITNGSLTAPLTGITVTAVKGITGLSQTLTQGFVKEISAIDASASLSLPGGTTANIETININNSTGQTVNGDAAKFVGVTKFVNVSSAANNDVVLTNVEVSTTLGIKGKSGIAATFKDSTTAAPVKDGAVNVSLDAAGLTSAFVAVSATAGANQTYKTLNVDAVSGSSFATVAGDAVTSATTLNVTGAGNASIKGVASSTLDSVTTVNASAATGNVTVDLGGNAKDVTVTGGSGNDKFVFGAGLTAGDKVNGGSGTDTVSVSSTSGLVAATDASVKAVNAFTSVEKLELTGATATVNASVITSLNSFVFSTGSGAVAVTGVEAGDTFEVANARTGASAGSAGAGTHALSFAPKLDSAADTLTLSVKGDLSGGAGNGSGNLGGSGLDAGSFETVNLTVNAATTFAGGAIVSSSTAGSSFVVATNATVNISGAFDVNLGTVVGTNTVINAGTLTGKLTVVGDAGNNVITGGSGDDVIAGGAGIDTINISAGGKDTISFGTATTAANASNITGFEGSGNTQDVLNFTGTNAGSLSAGAATTTTTALVTTAIADFTIASIVNAVNGATGTTTGQQVVILAGGFTGGTATAAQLEAGLEGSALTGGGILIVADSATSARVFHDTNFASGTDGTGLAQIGTISGTDLNSLGLDNVAII